MTLSKQQEKQELAYRVPYHWLSSDRTDQKGRLYFGYIDFCVALATQHGGPILDAGCGDARLLGELSKKTTEKLYGTDYSERAIAFARLLVPEAEFAVADLTNLPYSDNFFEQVFLIETLEHIKPEQIPEMLTELRRVLQPGGRLIITVPSVRQGLPGPDSKHYQHFSPTSLRETVDTQFTIEKMYGQWKSGFHVLKIMYRLIDNSLWDIRPLRIFFNRHLWPRYLNICKPEEGSRLIAVCVKSDA